MAENKVRFCWECGKKLWNVKLFTKMVIDGYKRTLHKICAKELKTAGRK